MPGGGLAYIHPSPPIATTAADGDAAARLRGAGFDAAVGKPVSIEVLRVALADHIELHGPAGLLDDTRAAASAGGDTGIIAALRGLFATELDTLPDELAGWVRHNDRNGLRERLHRLAASAGFCGAVALAAAVGKLQLMLDEDSTDLDIALTGFLATVRATRAALTEFNAPRQPTPRR